MEIVDGEMGGSRRAVLVPFRNILEYRSRKPLGSDLRDGLRIRSAGNRLSQLVRFHITGSEGSSVFLGSIAVLALRGSWYVRT